MQVILENFRNVLIEEDLQPHQNFFDVGGDSLIAAELLIGLKAAIPANATTQGVSLRALFEHPTAEGLANYLTS